MPLETYKLVVTVPADHTEALLQAMGEAGGGQLDNKYDYCAFIVRGEGRFRPLQDSHPAMGQIGQIEKVIEDRIEVSITGDVLQSVLDAIRRTHPYEVPVIDIYTLFIPQK